MENKLNFLSSREGFNTALRHFKSVNRFIGEFNAGYNLADTLNEAINANEIKQIQVKSVLNALLIDKFNYFFKSYNLKNSITNEKFKEILKTINQWNKFDIICAYYHPQLGIILFNPKNMNTAEMFNDGLKENELLNMYVGALGNDFDHPLAEKACESIINLLEDNKVSSSIIKQLQDGTPAATPKQPAMEEKKPQPEKTASQPQPEKASTTAASPAQKKKLSPQYGIIVANELFHNGNVEAWKKIIASYEQKYPDTKVLVFYDNEQIHDINTLFKWGKVKHGTMIFFCLLGPEFRSISKLRRYLAQGASHKFEAFLKGAPNQILNLF